ncbi:MAG: VTC domain-containing protein, partial [Verrucomicrobiae bacterium]|nr:VTC domain-containing protein [Verrucomicrobiae bacterium]
RGLGDVYKRQILAARDSEQLPPAAKIALSGLDVVLGNRYLRHYFVSADGQVRLTIDRQMRFFSFNESNGQAEIHPPATHSLIIELKYAPAHSELAAGIAQEFPFRPQKCSKYVLGITLILS